MALKEIGQFDQADILLARAIALEPRQSAPAVEYARIAERRGDQQEALRRWELMRDRIEDQAGWVGSARILCQLDREYEAIEMLTKAHWRFPSRPEPLIELADVYHRRGLMEEEARQWQTVRHQFPQNDQGYINGSRALRELGRHEEAAEVIQHYTDVRNLSHDDG